MVAHCTCLDPIVYILIFGQSQGYNNIKSLSGKNDMSKNQDILYFYSTRCYDMYYCIYSVIDSKYM